MVPQLKYRLIIIYFLFKESFILNSNLKALMSFIFDTGFNIMENEFRCYNCEEL